ncbi:MAG: oligosaccharide flippase family protein, partial [Thermotogota bacterium]|nr:oligosaccharide flippase family protein [Thermotogota bacterium]
MASNEFGFLLKHSTIYGISTVLSQAIGFIMLPVYTRYLTPKDYGVLNLIEITTAMAGMILTTGIADTISRFYYDHKEQNKRNKTVSTLYISYFIICFGISPIFYFSSPILSTVILDSQKYTQYFYISFISLVLGGLLDIGLIYLRILNKSVIFTLISVTRLI